MVALLDPSGQENPPFYMPGLIFARQQFSFTKRESF